jgi:pimeloyl-ACP methyl ester carboxylesterase
MLEMLNPSVRDVFRFAANVIRVRTELNRVFKKDQVLAGVRAAQIFSTPPAAARRPPSVERLRGDTQRFFGWSSARWKKFEVPINTLLARGVKSTIVHNGFAVQCYQWSPIDERGQPRSPRGRILLSHGWEGYAYNFILLISKAVDAGYEVHAFDHVAHGASTGTIGGLQMTLETLLAVAKHITNTHGNIDVLVGHSLGGAAAAWACAHRAITPKRLVLIAPFYDTYTLSSLWAKAHLLPDEIRAALQHGLESAAGKTFADFMPPALAPLLNQQPDLQVFIVHDRSDKITAFKHSAAMARLGQRVMLHETANLGHIAVLADDVCADAVIEFIAMRG